MQAKPQEKTSSSDLSSFFELRKEIKIDNEKCQVLVDWQTYPGSREDLEDLSLPQKRRRPSDDSLNPILVYDAGSDNCELHDYLELCMFMMNDAAPQCRGLLLRGSSQHRERAYKLLADSGNDYELAKLHVLFPIQMAFAETRTALEDMVRDERPSIK